MKDKPIIDGNARENLPGTALEMARMPPLVRVRLDQRVREAVDSVDSVDTVHSVESWAFAPILRCNLLRCRMPGVTPKRTVD